MAADAKMNSRELGLVLAQQLLDVEDLHYGLWDEELEPSIRNLAMAQQRYTDMLLDLVACLVAGVSKPHLLDVGCGTGHMLSQMLVRGWCVDAVNPSTYLNRRVRERLAGLGVAGNSKLLEMDFLAIPQHVCRQQYDLLLFSESFQYISPLPALLAKLPSLVKPGGNVVICDFFKTDAHCDGGEGDRSFSGGHILSEFYRLLDTAPFTIVRDTDLTPRVSPNIALIDDWLTRRMAPAAGSVNTWLEDNHPRLTRLLKWLLRRRLERVRYKYLSGHRSQEVFEKYKSYRLLVLRRVEGA